MKLFPFFLFIIFFSSSVDSTEIATFKISHVIDNSLEFDKFLDKLDVLKNIMQNELLENEEINLIKYKPLLKLYDQADIINDLV